MRSVENTKIEERKLILLARFHPDFVRNELLPEIEANSVQYHVEPQLLEYFRKCRFAENSLYFHHNYAYADIPAGQEYEFIMRICDGIVVPDSVMECKAKVLCFFSAFKTHPIAHANQGHHENCLIQFQEGIPDMIQELYEIRERTPIEVRQEIGLCSYETLRANLNGSSKVFV